MARSLRLLDGYIGILGFVMHYKACAWYSHVFHIFNLSLRLPFLGYMFYFDVSRKSWDRNPDDIGKILFRVEFFKFRFMNAVAARDWLRYELSVRREERIKAAVMAVLSPHPARWI